MRADKRFVQQPKEFWANVRTISQRLGYTERKTKAIKIPALDKILKCYAELELNTGHLVDRHTKPTKLGELLLAYFKFRAELLNKTVQHSLMDKGKAQQVFDDLKKRLAPNSPLPLNKQKGEKKNFAFLTGIVNMLIEASIGDIPCDYDPRSLTTVTHDKMPLRTLARRVDGAFPSVVDPVAVWEIKEYYYTTTFGSRVADGVYETLLDGMELEELEQAAQRKIHHLLVIDDHFTWWECGRSYLCRMIDMLHMGYVDEVIFGIEVVERLPALVEEWKADYLKSIKPKN